MGVFFFRKKKRFKKEGSYVLEPHLEEKSTLNKPIVILFLKINGQSKIYELPHDRNFTIGSDPKNDLCLKESGVSPFHAKISPVKDSYVLYNLLSNDGVKVNRHEVHKYRLRFGDRIEIGPEILLFDLKQGYRRDDEFFEGAERRKSVRISPPLTLRFIVYSQNKAKEFVAFIKDISLEGVRIELEEKLPKGSMIEAQIYSPELPSIDLIGTVVREIDFDKGGRIFYEVGMQFLEMSDEARERLHNYLVRCIS
ncbi:MAG: PilZ domain-containing protein [Candidatus Ratteibacteria bacterium]|nr:PilZ domain-containing protein [Candidatus Ratteibacteria bacterium]